MNFFSRALLCLLALREDQLFSGCEIRVDDTSQMSKQEKNRLPCHYLPRPALAQQRIIPQSTLACLSMMSSKYLDQRYGHLKRLLVKLVKGSSRSGGKTHIDFC